MQILQRLKRQRWIVLASILSALLLVACGQGSTEQATGEDGAAAPDEPGGTIKIGLLVPQSGVYAQLGEDMRQAWDLWLEQNDNRFGDFDVETVVADEGESPDTGVPALQRLVQAEDVDVVVGVVNSAVALGGADVVTEAGKLFLISNAGANALTGESGNELIWRTSYTNSQRGYASGEYLATLDDVKDGVFVIAADYAAGQEDIAGFRKAFEEEGGGTIVGEAYTPFGTTDDFQPYLSQIQQSGAKAVYAFYAGAETVAFINQYDAFNLRDEIPLYGAGVITEGVLGAVGASAEGITTVWHYSSELDNPANVEFVQSYTDAYDAPPTVFSAQSWDAAIVLDKALSEAGDVSGAALAEALENLGPIENSPRGSWTFEGRNPNHPIYLREVQEKDGVFVNAVLEELGIYAQPNIEG